MRHIDKPTTDPAHDVLRAERRPLDVFFSPATVAVIGATEKKDSRFTAKGTMEKLVARFARENLLCAIFVLFVLFMSFVVKSFSPWLCGSV